MPDNSKIILRLDDKQDDKNLRLVYEVTNSSDEDILVLNGLWTLNAQNQFQVDQECAYRFVLDEHQLLILAGVCPLPSAFSPFYQNVSHAKRLAFGAKERFHLNFANPVKEYNVYFPEHDQSAYKLITVDEIRLSVQYLVASDAVKTRPSLIDERFEEVTSADAFGNVETIVASAKEQLSVKLRTDDFERPKERKASGGTPKS